MTTPRTDTKFFRWDACRCTSRQPLSFICFFVLDLSCCLIDVIHTTIQQSILYYKPTNRQTRAELYRNIDWNAPQSREMRSSNHLRRLTPVDGTWHTSCAATTWSLCIGRTAVSGAQAHYTLFVRAMHSHGHFTRRKRISPVGPHATPKKNHFQTRRTLYYREEWSNDTGAPSRDRPRLCIPFHPDPTDGKPP